MKRRLLRAASVLLLVIPLLAAVAPAAQAITMVCEPGAKTYKISSANAVFEFTHSFDVFSVVDGQTHTQDGQLSYQKKYGAGIDGNFTVDAHADVIIVKGGYALNLALHGSGEWTTTNTVTVTDDIANNTGVPQRYVYYAGTNRATGTYIYNFCNSKGAWVTTKGTWGSWVSNWKGWAQCSKKAWYKNNYGIASPEYRAVVQSGCG